MHHYIKVWLQTEAEPLSFPVAEAAWGRFKRSFAAKRKVSLSLRHRTEGLWRST